MIQPHLQPEQIFRFLRAPSVWAGQYGPVEQKEVCTDPHANHLIKGGRLHCS